MTGKSCMGQPKQKNLENYSKPGIRLIPVPFLNGEVPPMYISILSDLYDLSDEVVTALLVGYGKDVTGTTKERKHRLALAIGVQPISDVAAYGKIR